MEIKLLSQNQTAGDEISQTLKSGKYSDFRVAVAYSRNSGISRIYTELSYFKNNGGNISVIAGIDQHNTSYQALVNLKSFANDNLYIHYDRNFNITFHPKVYLFGNQNIEKVIVGSSNLTAGGLFLNYEANINVTLDSSQDAINFKNQIDNYWSDLLTDVNTKKCDLPFIDTLLANGAVIDEQNQQSFKAIIDKIPTNLPFGSKSQINNLPPIVPAASAVLVPQLTNNFAMTLSGFDVSSKSADPILLIPIASLKMFPLFWNWPFSYSSSIAGYPQLYANASIKIDGTTLKNQIIRIYYYDSRSEFRFQCEPIKRNGTEGDIILISKKLNNPSEFNIELIRANSVKYHTIIQQLNNRVSPKKTFGYF